MSVELFYLIVYVTLGFSFIPFFLFFLIISRKRVPSIIVSVISILEFSTFLSNVLLDANGLGQWKLQFTIYYVLELSCWYFVLSKFYLSKHLSFFLIISSLIAIIYFQNLGYSTGIKYLSKSMQFILGLILLTRELRKNELKTNSSYIYFTAFGLIIYSLVSLNLTLLNDLIMQMNVNNFILTWTTHQIAAIIYFSLLSISIWKSQKI
jgi:hypothetical protein